MSRLPPISGALLAFVVAVGPACGTRRSQQECRLECENVVAATNGTPSAVAIGRAAADRYWAAWSAAGETWVASLGERGQRLGDALRIDRGGNGVISAAVDGGPHAFWPDGAESSFAAEHLAVAPLPGGGAIIGVLERESESRPGGAIAVLVREDGAVERVEGLGPAGPFSSRISAVAWGEGALVAWHDAAVEASAVRAAVVAADGRRGAELTLRRVRPAFSPSLAVNAGRAILVWTESKAGGAAARFDVLAAEVLPGPSLAEPAAFGTATYLDPAPSAAAGGDGFAAAFRDNRDDDSQPEYYFADLDPRGALRHGPARISRADGPEGPRLAAVGSAVLGVQIRTFGASLLVGMNRFDAEGRKRGGEFQIYADKSDFTRADVAPGERRAILLYTEDRDGSGRVLSGAVTCRGM